MEGCNSAISDVLRAVPKFAIGGRVWVYNPAATIRQGAKTDTDAKVLKAKLSSSWTGSYNVLTVGPCTPADTPDGSPLGAELLYLHLPSDIPGEDARGRVSVQRCKPCANPHDRGDMSQNIPAGLAQYVLKTFPKKSPRTTLLKTTFRLLLNHVKWRTLTDTNRFAVEVESPR